MLLRTIKDNKIPAHKGKEDLLFQNKSLFATAPWDAGAGLSARPAPRGKGTGTAGGEARAQRQLHPEGLVTGGLLVQGLSTPLPPRPDPNDLAFPSLRARPLFREKHHDNVAWKEEELSRTSLRTEKCLHSKGPSGSRGKLFGCKLPPWSPMMGQATEVGASCFQSLRPR